jgi:hypothetical protein
LAALKVAVLFHQSVADGQAQPGALAHLLGGEEGVEDAAQVFGGGRMQFAIQSRALKGACQCSVSL